jgi:hypothetical protein
MRGFMINWLKTEKAYSVTHSVRDVVALPGLHQLVDLRDLNRLNEPAIRKGQFRVTRQTVRAAGSATGEGPWRDQPE